MAGRSHDSEPEPITPSEKRPSKGDIAQPAPPVEEHAAVEETTFKTPQRAALDTAFRAKADLRQGLTENLGRERARNLQMDERVHAAFKNFDPSTRAASEPTRRNQVEPGAAPFETMSRVMTERLDALKAAEPEHRIAIRATSPLIKWDRDDDAKAGTIALDKLIEFIDARGVASLTFSPSSAVAECEAERKAQAIIDELETAPATGENGVAGGTPAVSASDGASVDRGKVADFVETSVHTQMGPATAPEAQLSYGLIPNGAGQNKEQARLLETFELRPGPSDVTAYHDFSVLQIAFEDAWTRMFDGELEALGRELYREYVGLKDFLDYDPDTADRPISSLDDLTWLIGEIRFLSQIAQESIPTGNGNGNDAPLGTGNIPQSTNDIAKGAKDFVESLPGGRVGTAIGTLGISELVLLFLNEAGNFGKKTALRWDDLVNGRTLQRGDRIMASVDQNIANTGEFQLVLRTDISNAKEVAFEIQDQTTQRFGNYKKVSNTAGDIIRNSRGEPDFYVHEALIPSDLRAIGLLEFSSQEGGILLGRYVLGDLDKIVPDRGRLTLYWKDR